MGEKKTDQKENWDFKVPENNKERIQEKVRSRSAAPSRKVKTLDPMTGNKDLSEAKKKLQTPGKKLSIENSDGARKKRTTRSQLAQKYDFQDKIEKLIYTNPIQRIVAGVIDIIYLGVLGYSSQFLIPMAKKEYMKFLVENGINQMLAPETLHQYLWMAIASLCFLALYFLPTMLLGKSIGKAMKGYRIGDSKEGNSISRGTLFVREFVLRPLSLISVIGLGLMFTNKKNQTLHDKLLGTSVYSD
ncbi:MAG: hypothetical protein CME60_07785 [Halobacteriovoraceae bacterium]|nr:hypothetical protein [Halobacteriovoraceae bacterium]